MAYSTVQICNLALSKIGDEGGQITAITENSKEGNLCAKFYEPALRETLRMHPWNCAKARKVLAKSTEDPAFGWNNAYPLPADCVRPLEISASDSTNRAYKYNTEWSIEGRCILTNADSVYLLYVKYLTDPNMMDELFIRAFYTALALKLAYPLTEDRILVSNLRNELYEDILPEARRVNSFEGHVFPSVDSEWLEATLGSGGANPPFGQTHYGNLP